MSYASKIIMTQGDAPSKPLTGTIAIYSKSDGFVYTKNDQGVETMVTTPELPISSSITDNDTSHAPSGNAVYDALALKANLVSPSFTTPALGIPSSGTLTNCTGLPQAGVTGLTTTDSPVFGTVKLSNLTDGYIPKHTSDAVGLENSPIYTDGTVAGIGTTHITPNNASAIVPKFVTSGLGTFHALQVVRANGGGFGGSQVVLSSTKGVHPEDYTALVSGEGIGTVSFNGADGTRFITSASIQVQVDGVISTDNVPARMNFLTSAGGANNPTERMRITSAGLVGINTTSPASKLSVAGNLSVGSSHSAIAAPTNGAIFEGSVGIGNSNPTNKLDVAGVATAYTAPDNTSTTQLATTAFAKSQDAVLARLPDQAVNMTYAASGSSGISVADNDNIDFGTGNFTLVWRGNLPDWTPSANVILLQKLTSSVGYQLEITTTGAIKLTLNTTAYTSSVVSECVDGTTHDIEAIVTVGATNTTVDFYLDGVALGAQQTATNPGTVSNSALLYAMGTSAARTAGTCSFAATFNRALSAAEVLYLYRNGISYADKWGALAAFFTSNFSADTYGYAASNGTCVGNIDGIAGVNDTLRYTCNNLLSSEHQISVLPAYLVYGATYKVTLDYYIPSTNSDINGICIGSGGSVVTTPYNTLDSWTSISVTYSCPSISIYAGFRIYAHKNSDREFQDLGGDDVFYIKNVNIYRLGATLALEPEGIQNDKWYDSSSNALNASYPAAGWSLTRNLNVPRTNTGQPAFLVRSAILENVSGDGTIYKIPFTDSAIKNINSCFSTDTFTAPVTGLYHFSIVLDISGLTSAHTRLQLNFKTSNRDYYIYDQNPFATVSNAPTLGINTSLLVDMDAGDTAYINFFCSSGTKVVDLCANGYGYFSGHLVC